MPREKKDGRYINYRIKREIYEMLERYAEEKGQSKTVAIERILEAHLSAYFAENTNNSKHTTKMERPV